jgi:hypothetical protein
LLTVAAFSVSGMLPLQHSCCKKRHTKTLSRHLLKVVYRQICVT